MKRPGTRWWAALAVVVLIGALPARGQEEERDRLDAEVKLTVGVAHLNNDDYRQALAKFEEAIQLDAENGTAHLLAATSLNRLQRYQESLDHLEKARQYGAQAPPGRIDWFEGESRYWLGEYDAAESLFRLALDGDPADAYAHFYLGLTLLSLRRGQEAADHFDRAVALDKKLGGNSAFYAGKSHFEGGDLARARSEFEKALSASETSENARKASTNYLSAVQTAAPAGPPRGELRVGYAAESDSNVVLEPDDGFPPTAGEQVSDEGDFRHTISLRGALYPFYDRAGWSMGLILNAYQSIHSDLSEFDLLAPQGIVSFSWGKDPQGFVNGPIGYTRVATGSTRAVVTLQGGYSFYDLDGDDFLSTLELGGSVKIAEGAFTSTRIDLDYRDNDFDQFRARTGTYTQFRLIQNIYLGGRRERTLRVGLRSATNDADEITPVEFAALQPAEQAEVAGISDDYDYDETELFVDFALSLPSRVALFFQASFQQQEYDNLNSNPNLNDADPNDGLPVGADPADLDVRDDDRLVLSGSVAWNFTRHWGLIGRLSHYQNDSNKGLFEYDRNVASVGISYYY